MAGRGRQSTLPAWMSSTEGGGEPPIVSNSDTFADAPTNRPEGDTRPDAEQERRSMIDGRKPRSRSRDRGDRDRGGRDGRGDRDSHRDRGRDRDRDDRGGRGSDGRREPPPREPSPPAWQPKPNRQSNFDVVGPGGEELPGVGVGILSTGVGLGGMPPSHGGGHGGSSSSGGMRGHGGGGGGGGSMLATQVYGPGNDNARQQQTRHARRLYVGGLPAGTQEEELLRFFSSVIDRATAPYGVPDMTGPAVVQTYINTEKCFGFVELATMELTASCMNLSGIKFDNHMGQSILRIKRPNDFKPELVPPTMQPLSYFNYGVLDIVGTAAPSGGGGGDGGSMGAPSADRIFCGGLPYHLTDDQVKELLGAFGAIRTFNLVRDPGSVTSKGYCFCEYANTASTQTAIAGLHGLPIGDKTLTVRLAAAQNSAGGGGGGGAQSVQQYSMYQAPPQPSGGQW